MTNMIAYLFGRLIGAFLLSLLFTWIWSLIYRAIKKKPISKFWLKVFIIAVIFTIISLVGTMNQQNL
ncbi:hypothetical protein [Oceanobacillus sojae]|uniref:hypothetical protein n=1 Tax=Oceanobacillus sojae TaxID=582851 RepID=UPI0021A3AD57|nr:hypothetical protein [Oceanobacillus sojae]MCT1902005.1 hypothetical protein [Oceanobacillus sojae]